MKRLKQFLNLEFYESELDGFLQSLARKYPKPSESQRQEIQKYKRINGLRDKPALSNAASNDFWENF